MDSAGTMTVLGFLIPATVREHVGSGRSGFWPVAAGPAQAAGLTRRSWRSRPVAPESLRKIEAGDLRPSAQLVESLAQALGVDDADQRYSRVCTGHRPPVAPVARKRKLRRPHSLPAITHTADRP